MRYKGLGSRKATGGEKSEVKAGAGPVGQVDLIVTSARSGPAAFCHRPGLQAVDARREVGKQIMAGLVGKGTGLEQAALHQPDGHIGEAGLIGGEKSVSIAVQVCSAAQGEEGIIRGGREII